MPIPTQQQALANVLEGQPQGGSAVAGGTFGAGADVPKVLADDPVAKQLLDEQVSTAVGPITSTNVDSQMDAGLKEANQIGADMTKVAPPGAIPTKTNPAIIKELERSYPGLGAQLTAEFGMNPMSLDIGTIRSFINSNGLKPAASFSEKNRATGTSATPERDVFAEQQDLIDRQAQEAEARVQRQIESQVAEAKTAQRQTRGAARVQLARMGALSTTTAGMQYETDLADKHQKEITGIQQKGAELIQDIRFAKENLDMELFSKKMDALRKEKENLVKAEGERLDNIKKLNEITQFQRDTASTTIDAMAEAGLSIDDIPSGYFDTLDQMSEYQAGTSALLFTASKKGFDDETFKDSLETMGTLFSDILPNMKPNQMITFNGVDYYGQDSPTEFVSTEIDKSTGDIISISRNKETGELTTSRQRAVLTPDIAYDVQALDDGKLWYVPKNPRDGAAIPVMSGGTSGANGVNYGNIQELFPNGFSYSKDGKAAGMSERDFWCLRFLGNLDERGNAFINEVGDSISSKRASVDPEIGFGAGQVPPSIGDYILTDEDSTYGHIGLITDIRQNEKGEMVAVLTESNYVGGTVTHNRTIRLDAANVERNGDLTGRILGFKKSQLKSQYTNQPESASTQLSVYDPKKQDKLDEEATEVTARNEQDKRAREVIEKKMSDIDKLLLQQDDVLKGAKVVGSNESRAIGGVVGARWTDRAWFLDAGKAERIDVFSTIQQIVDQKTIQELLDVKAQGGTFGALSETELMMLKNSATRLGGWIMKDKYGNPTGKLEVGEKTFFEELQAIQDQYRLAYEKVQGAYSTKYVVGENDSRVAEAQALPDEYSVEINGDGSVTITEL